MGWWWWWCGGKKVHEALPVVCVHRCRFRGVRAAMTLVLHWQAAYWGDGGCACASGLSRTHSKVLHCTQIQRLGKPPPQFFSA